MSESSGTLPTATEHEPDVELRRYYWVIRSRMWVVVACFVVVTCLAALYAFKTPANYEAVAQILIERQAPRVTTFQEVYQLQADKEYYKTQHELIKCKAVLEKALEKPGVARLFEVSPQGASVKAGWPTRAKRNFKALFGIKPAPLLEPWGRLARWVQVQPVRDSHLVDVRVKGRNPRSIAKIANAVAQAFEDFTLQRRLSTTGEASQLLERHKAEQEKLVRQAEEALQEFREETKLVSLDVEAEGNPILERLAQLNDQLTEVELRRIDLQAQVRAIKALQDAGKFDELLSIPAIRSDPMVTSLVNKKVDAQREWQEIKVSSGLLDAAPRVVAAQEKAELAKQASQDAVKAAVEGVSTQLETLSRREEELRQAYNEQNRLALELSRKSLTYERLRSDVERQRKLFDTLVERLREVDLSGGSETTNIRLVQSADVPKIPVGPKRTRTVTLGAVLGLMLGIGLAFFFDYLDDRIKTPEDVQRYLRTAALGFVPDMKVDKTKAQMDGFAQRGLVSLIKPHSPASEAYRTARTSIYFSSSPKSAKTILVTSVEPKEGKTTTASNLALVMAQSGDRVLLVDADLRKPMLHEVFGLPNESGLTDVLSDEASAEDSIVRPYYDGKNIDNLDVLFCGTKTRSPAELLGSGRMRELVQALSQKYDRIIFDSPPALLTTDASILADICDGVLLVMKAASCRRGPAQRAKQQLESVNASILGGLLNDVVPSKARYGYYGYSGYYYYGYSRYYKDYYGSEKADEEEKS